jgi:dihydroneopterin aldolase
MFIRLNGIEIFAHHGVNEEEIKSGNHFEIDVEIEVAKVAGTTSDQLQDTLDYTKILKSIIAISDKRRYNLLEAFAHDICGKLFDVFSDAENVTVKIRKLNPPMAGSVKNAEVELTMARNA